MHDPDDYPTADDQLDAWDDPDDYFDTERAYYDPAVWSDRQLANRYYTDNDGTTIVGTEPPEPDCS